MNPIGHFVDSSYPIYDGTGERLLGIEIEVEQCQNREWVDSVPNYLWSYTGDGSLRNYGCEFVSIPLPDERLGVALAYFYEAFRRHDYDANERTGIHVHVDVRDLTMEYVGGIIATYAVVEPLLMQYVGANREENIYCVPFYRADTDIPNIRQAITEGTPRWTYETCKYSALYLEPLNRFGTIEFRQAPTYTQRADLDYWITIIRKLVQFGAQRTVNEVIELTTRTTGEEFCRAVFGEEYDRLATFSAVPVDMLLDNCDSWAVVERLAAHTTQVVSADWQLTSLDVGGEPLSTYYANSTSEESRGLYNEPDPFELQYEVEMDDYYEDEEYE